MNLPKGCAQLIAGHGYGRPELLSWWQGRGDQHSFGKVTGLLVGLLVGPEQWGGAAEEAERQGTEGD